MCVIALPSPATYEPRSKPGYAQLLSRWRFNSIFTAESGEPVNFFDDGDDISGTGEYDDRWNLHGNPKNIHWSRSKGLPWYEFNSDYPGTINTACEQMRLTTSSIILAATPDRSGSSRHPSLANSAPWDATLFVGRTSSISIFL